LLRRPGADVRPTALAVEAPDRVAEEVKRLLRQPRESGLLLVHSQPQPGHQPAEGGQRRRPGSGPAADDQGVRVVDHTGLEALLVPDWPPREDDWREVGVG